MEKNNKDNFSKMKYLVQIMPHNELIDDIVNFRFEYSKNYVSYDYFTWKHDAYIKEYFLNKGITNIFKLAGSKYYYSLLNIYHETDDIWHKKMEAQHYYEVMSHIDECIEWGGYGKNKFTHAEINLFFKEQKIRIRWNELKMIFYLVINLILKNNLSKTEIEKLKKDNIEDYLKDKNIYKNPPDCTKYYFNGNIYAKNRFVLAVVIEHIKRNPQATLMSIQKDFEIIINGKSLEYIQDYNLREKVGEPHYFMDSVINLDNGDKLVVSNSAPFIKLFIKKAIELGYEFEAIENMADRNVD